MYGTAESLCYTPETNMTYVNYTSISFGFIIFKNHTYNKEQVPKIKNPQNSLMHTQKESSTIKTGAKKCTDTST